MKQFAYKSKNRSGTLVAGDVSAENETEAVAELRRRGLTVLALEQGRASPASGGAKKAASGQRRMHLSLGSARVRGPDLVMMTRQLATMVSAGIPLVEGLEILEDQMTNPVLKRTLSEVVSDVRSGKDLSVAMASHPRVFSSIFVSMIRAGEASGQLDTVLDRLANYQEESEKLRGEIKSAMTYPTVSLVMIFGITIFLLVFIIPKFEEMFLSMKVELPWVTSALLGLSLFMKTHFLLIGLACVAVVVGTLLWFRTDRGGWVRDWMFLHMPIVGSLFSKAALSRFSKTFSTLIRSGVPILGALEIVESTTGNRLFTRVLQDAGESVRQGETLAEPLGRSKVFPLMVTRMIGIGERTGSLEALLEKVAEFYDAQVSAAVKSLTSLIEPLMIAVMGIVVGSMVMAIFLPIFKMIGSMNR